MCMVLTYYGKQFLKITQGDMVIAYNPPRKEYAPTKFGSALVLSSNKNPFADGIETVTYGETTPFVIDGPGEYEIHDMDITGVGQLCTNDDGSYYTTVYQTRIDGISVVFLGYLSEGVQLNPKVREIAERADVIILPIGDDATCSPSAAYKLALSCTPSLIIPVSYTKDHLARFLKEGGQEVTPIDKLTLKRKDLDGKEGVIVVLDPQ